MNGTWDGGRTWVSNLRPTKPAWYAVGPEPERHRGASRFVAEVRQNAGPGGAFRVYVAHTAYRSIPFEALADALGEYRTEEEARDTAVAEAARRVLSGRLEVVERDHGAQVIGREDDPDE